MDTCADQRGQGPAIVVRQATAADAAVVLASLEAVRAETDNLAGCPEDPLPTLEEAAALLGRIRESSREAFFVALVGGELAGTANLAVSSRPRLCHRGEVGLAVRRRFWGQGVGGRLMEELLAFARAVGLEILSLEVRSDNVRALRLYERLGFERVGRFDGFMKVNGELVSCDIMRLDLTR